MRTNSCATRADAYRMINDVIDDMIAMMDPMKLIVLCHKVSHPKFIDAGYWTRVKGAATQRLVGKVRTGIGRESNNVQGKRLIPEFLHRALFSNRNKCVDNLKLILFH